MVWAGNWGTYSIMPLTAKGRKIKKAMVKEYGKKGKAIFYASQKKGTIKGTHK